MAATVINGHAFHVEVEVAHAFLGLLAEILLALAELLGCLIIMWSLELLMAPPHIMLRSLSMLVTRTTTNMILNHFLDLRVIQCLSHFVNFYLDNFCRIIVLILSRHPLPIL